MRRRLFVTAKTKVCTVKVNTNHQLENGNHACATLQQSQQTVIVPIYKSYKTKNVWQGNIFQMRHKDAKIVFVMLYKFE